MNRIIIACLLPLFFLTSLFPAEKDSVEWLEDEMHSQLFEKGPFRGKWETERVRRADRDTYERLLQMSRKRVKANWTPELKERMEAQLKKNHAHWLTERETLISLEIEMDELLFGKLRKTTVENGDGGKWDNIHFSTELGIVRQITNEDSNTFVIEQSEYEIFWHARAAPNLWVLQCLEFTEGIQPTIDRSPEGEEEIWRFLDKEEEDLWELHFTKKGMIPFRVRHLQSNSLRQDIQVIEGVAPFPERTLTNEYSRDGKLWASEETKRIDIKRIKESEVGRPEIHSTDKVLDRGRNPTRPARELNPSDFRKLLQN